MTGGRTAAAGCLLALVLGTAWAPSATARSAPPDTGGSAAERSEGRGDDGRSAQAVRAERTARRAAASQRQTVAVVSVPAPVAAAAPLPVPVAPTPVVPALPPALPPTLPPAVPVSGPAEFTVASFNILGSNHTPRGSGWADGVTRARWASELVLRRGFDVVGLQEIQVDQLATVMAATGGAFASHPALGTRGTAVPQAVMWRTDTWELLTRSSLTIPFVGERREQAIVLLRHRASGQSVWFVNMHLSPRRDRRPAEDERNEATALLVAKVRELQATGLPVVVTGDMNEKEEIFCDLGLATGLTAANGGSTVGGCRPPRSRIDWVFGSPSLRWTGFAYHEDGEVRRITDHPVAVAGVRIG